MHSEEDGIKYKVFMMWLFYKVVGLACRKQLPAKNFALFLSLLHPHLHSPSLRLIHFKH